jgi:uncharacterized protein (DUF58 family)
MNATAIALTQTIIYWTLLVLLISWIMIFTVLSLRSDSLSTAEVEYRAPREPAPTGGMLVSTPRIVHPSHPQPQPQALQAIGVAASVESEPEAAGSA